LLADRADHRKGTKPLRSHFGKAREALGGGLMNEGTDKGANVGNEAQTTAARRWRKRASFARRSLSHRLTG
jgi:hypothetical protein